ncbi:unnamed protein product [Nippostrongylus brasiliensis]|uniref:C2H2-type domain-containing protein n=1 Tax=Nippostrongylus brasiliensis TaxID=27835 RepID=A0A0N4XZ06_NIPBR|nr:unnamed protein product [Nippostrongylus brasiliensis]
MKGSALRAIQEDHSLSANRIPEFVDERCSQLVKEDLDLDKNISSSAQHTSQEPSTSSSTECPSKNQAALDTLLCAHPHCHATFPDIGDLISHLVSFHCQHQFRLRKLTFVSMEKYESWKSQHEKTYGTVMIEHGEREETEGVLRIRYHCEYCNNWRRQFEHPSSVVGSCVQVTVGCPSHLVVSVFEEKNTVSVVGCFAHLGHTKKLVSRSMRKAIALTQRSTMSPAQCKYCRRWFASQLMMNRHVKDEHNDVNYAKGTTIECGDPQCDVVCDRMSTLCEHVAQEHGREDLAIEEIRFASSQRFKEWKDEVEVDTMSKYVLSSSRTRASGVIQSYYLCHLSGYANRSRHSTVQVSRLRATKKLGRYCTAFLNTKELPDGTVIVQCCLGHFGHDFDVRRLPLPSRVRDEVADLLMKGTDPQLVYDIVRKKYTAAERGYYLKRYEVRNIADKLRKQGLISERGRELVFSSLASAHGEHALGKVAVKRPQQNIRFQSLRSLPDHGQHAKLLSDAETRTGGSRDRHYSYSVRGSTRTENSSTIEGLRDVSPPIIGPCEYVQYSGDNYEEIDVIVREDDDDVAYYVEESQDSESVLDIVHNARGLENASSSRTTKLTPLLMEPQPTGNVGFDETMSSLRRRINALCAEMKQTSDEGKLNVLMAEVRDLQAQLVRGVPQTSVLLQPVEQDFDGEDDGDDGRYEPIERDDAVCQEVEVESSEAPFTSAPEADEHYEDDLSTVTFETGPYGDVASMRYEHSPALNYNS